MMHEYVIDGVSLQCRDAEYVAEDIGLLRVEPIGYCRNIDNINREVIDSMKKITWINEQYKCSSLYHKMEPREKGDCMNCDDPLFIDLGGFIENIFVKITILHESIISKSYNIEQSQSLCDDILNSLSSTKDNISDNSEIIKDAFYIQRSSMESLFDNVLTMVGIPNQGIIGEFIRLDSYIDAMNRELSGLDNLLPFDQ